MILAARSILNLVIILSAVFSLDTFAQARPAKTADQTWSDYLQFIEKNQAEKDRIFHQEMQLTNSKYAVSKNRKAIEAVIKKRSDVSNIIQSATLQSGETLKLIDNGLGKSIDLVKVGTTNTVLYSNFQIKKNNSVAFTGFSVSPQSDYAIIFADQNGSIDDHQLVLIDLKQSKVIPSSIAAYGGGKSVSIDWISNSAFYFEGQDKLGYTIDLNNSVTPTPTNGTAYYGTFPRNIRCSQDGVQFIDVSQAEPVKINLENIPCSWRASRITSQNIDLLISDPKQEEHLKILHFNLTEKKDTVPGTQIFELQNQVYDSFHIFDSKYFIQTHWGKTQSLFIVDITTGHQIDQIVVPEYASIRSIASAIINKAITITLTTAISTDMTTTYDYTTHAWVVVPNQNSILQDSNGLTYTSQIIETPSQDGTLIPFRLTYLKSTVLNENTPFLFKVYGGYDDAGGFYPEFNYLIRNLFIKKGGVLVTAALRGGNEFGTSWHTQASELNRMTTFSDLISIANYVINQKWTSKNKIIVTGTSAGGLVTLASGMLSPDSFGLLIPVSPPTDIIGKIRLDSRFFEGQKKEYGDPALPGVVDYMKKYSPLEQDFNPDKLPQILLIAGVNDSRVNSEHSFKMIEKLRENKVSTDKLNVLMINNSGHWLEDIGFQDLIAWRSNSVMWDKIYTFLNW